MLCKAAHGKCVDKAQPLFTSALRSRPLTFCRVGGLLDCCGDPIGNAARLLQAVNVIGRSAYRLGRSLAVRDARVEA